MMRALLCLVAIFYVYTISLGVGVAPTIKLNDGREIPAVGLGTWLGFINGRPIPLQEGEVEQAVERAIDAGYRLFDTAFVYNTEEQVGKAVKKKIEEGVLTREEIFITTKLWNDKHAKEAVVPALRESLKMLDMDYVDLYLMHWPVGEFANRTPDNTDYLETWAGMAAARDLGLARSVGVCNFNQRQVDRLLAESSVKPAVVQAEINLNLQQLDLIAFCKSKGITVTAYKIMGSLLAGENSDAPPPRIDDPELVAMAQKYNKSVHQLNIKYEVELGVTPIPVFASNERMEENIDVFDFELTQEDRDKLRSYDRGHRIITIKRLENSTYYPFKENN